MLYTRAQRADIQCRTLPELRMLLGESILDSEVDSDSEMMVSKK